MKSESFVNILSKNSIFKSSKLIRRALLKAKRLSFNAIHGFPNTNVKNYGTISVIVPCYNVDAYLEKCLRSILDQDYPYVEVVVVDDGSPDDSFNVARSVARKDRRVKIVRQENRGLGGARNTGIEKSTGKFITFVDPDDTISRAGYLTMARTLHRTGSDFVVGTMQRQLGEKRWVPKWATSVHSRKRLRTVLEEDPTVLQDVFVCNKLFRKDFWKRAVGSFPERIRYEDQKPTALAYSRSTSFDVITEVVYTWVIREDGTSITQGKANIEDLRDRLNVKRSVKSVLESSVRQEVYDYWQAKAIGFDLESYFEQIPRTNDAYWLELQEGVRELAADMNDAAWSQVTFHNRAKAYAALFGTREDVAIILSEIQEHGRPFALIPEGKVLVSDADYLRRVSFEIPRKHRAAVDADISPVFRLLAADWTLNGDLEISGCAYIPGLTTAGKAQIELNISSTDADSSKDGRVFKAIQFDVIDADEIAADSYASHRSDGFKGSIPASWFEHAAALPGTEWQVEISLRFGHIEVTAPFNNRSNLGNAFKLNHGPLVDGIRIAPTYRTGPGLLLKTTPRRPVASSISIDDRHILIDFDPQYFESRSVSALYVQISHAASSEVILGEIDARDPYRVTAILPSISQHHIRHDRQFWQIKVGANASDLNFVQLSTSTSGLRSMPNSSSHLALDLSPNGYVRIEELIERVVVSNVRFSSSSLIVEVSAGDSSRLVDSEWVLVSTAGHRIDAEIRVLNKQTVHLDFPLANPLASVQLSEKSGGYSLRLLLNGFSYWVPVESAVADSFPLYRVNDRHRVRISRTPKAGALWMTLDAPLGWEERGKFMQRRLIQLSRSGDTRLQNATLFESYGGKNCSDSPLELSTFLKAENRGGVHYWTVKDASVQVPSGTVPVVLHSEEYHQALASSRVLVNNNNFPYYFSKRAGQKYIQTWHGTPLKKIGNDVPSANLSISYRELMKREAASWDTLIAQNDFAADQLPKSFGYEGRTIASGYPRNDALNSPEASETRKRVRNQMGLQDGQLVVLYAPTWRDNKRTASNQYKLVSYLEPSVLQAQLGDSITVLLRGHSNTAQGREAQNSHLVIDVTDHPDVNDLYLACDVLVTDYSSVMFDYVNTGKPIIYLVPDLESYSGDVRGFYLDFASIAPGPLTRSTAELADWLARPADLKKSYSVKYAEFAARFTSLDDGNASQRVAKEWDHL